MTIERDVAPATVAFSWLRTALRVLAGVVLVLVIALAIFFRSVETALAQYALCWATGDDVRIASVDNERDGIALDDATMKTPDGNVQLAATRIELGVRGGSLVASLTSPRVTLTVDRANANDLSRAGETLQRFGGGRDLALHIDDGSLVLVAADRPEMRIALDSIAGDATYAHGKPSYDVKMQLVAGLAHYPIAANAHADENGAIVQRWNADRIPLDALESLHLTPALAFRGGSLDDVVVSYGTNVHASATFDGVAFSLPHAIPSPSGDIATTLTQSKADPPTPPLETATAPPSVDLDRLRGRLIVDGNAVGTPGIAGRLNGVPFDMLGEVHDLGAPLDVLATGTRGLRQLGALAGMIGAQRHLTFARMETTAPGAAFAQFGVMSPIGPHVVTLVAADPKEPTLHLDTALSSDKVISKGERTSDLGLRTSAVAGLNGDYFDIGRTYEPQGMLMRAGTLVHGPADRAGLVIDKNGDVTFAEFHLAGDITTSHARFAITQVNSWPVGSATVITPDYGTMLRADPGTTFVRLEPIDAARGTYRVQSVEPATSELPVSFGVAFGASVKGTLPHAGERVVVHYGLTPNVPNAVSGIGGGPILLKDGAWYEDPHAPAPDERDVRWPVDALAKFSNGSLLFVAVDGRHPERSVGMTRPEFAALLQSFGASDAMALDSGGSVTLVSRPPGASAVAVRNKPSDDSAERYISDALFVYSSAQPPSLIPAPSPGASASANSNGAALDAAAMPSAAPLVAPSVVAPSLAAPPLATLSRPTSAHATATP